MNSKPAVIVEPYSLRNYFKKIGPGRFVLVQPAKKRINDPVAEEEQDPTKRYCVCGRKLNYNNKSGTCAVCIRTPSF